MEVGDLATQMARHPLASDPAGRWHGQHRSLPPMTHEQKIKQHLAEHGPSKLSAIASATGTGLGYARNIVYLMKRHGIIEPVGNAGDGTRARLYRLAND